VLAGGIFPPLMNATSGHPAVGHACLWSDAGDAHPARGRRPVLEWTTQEKGPPESGGPVLLQRMPSRCGSCMTRANQFVMSNVVLPPRISRYSLYHAFCASLPE